MRPESRPRKNGRGFIEETWDAAVLPVPLQFPVNTPSSRSLVAVIGQQVQRRQWRQCRIGWETGRRLMSDRCGGQIALEWEATRGQMSSRYAAPGQSTPRHRRRARYVARRAPGAADGDDA